MHNTVWIKSDTNFQSDGFRHLLIPSSGSSVLLQFLLKSTQRRCLADRASQHNQLGIAVPLQAWSGPEVSRKLRFPDFVTTAQDSDKVVSLTHRPPLPPGNILGIHFC